MTKFCSSILLLIMFASLVCASPTTVAPTTVAPTTVAPTTVAPTTVATTTVAPTTVEPSMENVTAIEGESRITGGSFNGSVKPYIGALWSENGSAPDYHTSGYEGKFVGFAIRLAPNMVIAHEDSEKLINKYIDKDRKKNIWYLNEIKFNLPPTMDLNHGKYITGGDLNRPNLLESGKLNGTPFRIYQESHRPLWNKTGPFPILERSKYNFGYRCFAYGWTGYPYPHELSRTNCSDHYKSSVRHFAYYEVVPLDDCKGALCRLESKVAQVCDDPIEYGQPVFCGPEEKLTYLIDKQVDGEACSRFIRAYHIAYFADEIDHYSYEYCKWVEGYLTPQTPEPYVPGRYGHTLVYFLRSSQKPVVTKHGTFGGFVIHQIPTTTPPSKAPTTPEPTTPKPTTRKPTKFSLRC